MTPAAPVDGELAFKREQNPKRVCGGHRSPFIQPSSYSIVMYEQKCPHLQVGAYTHLHLAAAPVVVIMNAPNYAALLGFAQGNLTEISSYDTHAADGAEASEPRRTKFNPAFQFAPPKGDMPTFRMTAGLPLITVSRRLSEGGA